MDAQRDQHNQIEEEKESMDKIERMTSFEKWMRTFVEEKDLPIENYQIKDRNGMTHFLDNYDMIEIIINALPNSNQKNIKETLVLLDFKNGDVNHFIKYLAERYIKTIY